MSERLQPVATGTSGGPTATTEPKGEKIESQTFAARAIVQPIAVAENRPALGTNAVPITQAELPMESFVRDLRVAGRALVRSRHAASSALSGVLNGISRGEECSRGTSRFVRRIRAIG
jgi:hypothetical protein